MSKYDVVIIGGGPAGSVAARTLAAHGVKVLLVEKDLKRVKPCGGAVPSAAFEEFNLPEEQITKKIKILSIISPAGFRIDTYIKKGYIALVERGALDSFLRRQAVESGADLIEAELLNLRVQGVLTTIMENGRERTITSDFLIVADGVNSRIARCMGLESLPCVYTIQEDIKLSAEGKFSSINSCEFWLGSSHAPHFYSWIFPKKDYIDIGTSSTDGKALKCLMKNFKMRCGINTEGRQKVYRLPLKQRKPLIYGNILFVGDAAGLVMPVSCEGIYYAMKSGKMAAEAIIAGKPKSYEKEWNRSFRGQFNFMGRFGRYFLKNDRLMEKLVQLHKSEKVQDASLKLWFEKDLRLSSFLSYISFFKNFLK
ncbi:MAG: geranylgeranyl reductase family protein [Candidatus Roizmanbacteria bacterium]|nr:geranylgeranyl reductase family protein [Candidatus Roizmanbacteria bacterium]